MCKDYELKKLFLQSFFKEIIGTNSTEKKNTMMHDYNISILNTEKGDNAYGIFYVAIREGDSAICVFDKEMMGSDEPDSFNVFDDHPYFQIIPNYEKEGSYYYRYSGKRHYKFGVAEQLCTAISFLLKQFIKKNREHYKK
jgi:hypothetical protein